MKRFLVNLFALGLIILAAWFCSLPLASGEQLPEFGELGIYGDVEIQEIDGGFMLFCVEVPCSFEVSLPEPIEDPNQADPHVTPTAIP